MNAIDRIVNWFSPASGFRRMQYRRAQAAYEAAKPSRLRKTKPDNSSGDGVMEVAGTTLRGYARQLEQNYDIAKGALDVLVNNIVGPHGITVEPMPRNTAGEIHADFAQELLTLYQDWILRPEVTWEHDWIATQRLACRTWLRDGEMLAQLLAGRVPKLQHGTVVPLSLELIEADQLPFDWNDYSKGIMQGVERNAWGRITAFHMLKNHPGDPTFHLTLDTKRVPADRMLHPKITQRIRQARGVSIFAAVMRRVEDLKDYEESERVAARVAAAFTAYIKKGTPEDYTAPESGKDHRTMSINPGTIFDTLEPGEEIGTIDSNRPSGLLTPFHNTMVRFFASGVGASNSSVSKNYNGTYSAQRQELVESWPNYQSMTSHFVGQFNRPVWSAFVRLAILSGAVQVPDDLDRRTVDRAEFRGPAMPWIDPQKEAAANKILERAGYKSAQQVIRERGGNPSDVMEQINTWREKAEELGLVFDTDPAKTAGSGTAQDYLREREGMDTTGEDE